MNSTVHTSHQILFVSNQNTALGQLQIKLGKYQSLIEFYDKIKPQNQKIYRQEIEKTQNRK